MSDFSTARWSAFQYKVSELMSRPEYKYKPSVALMKFLQYTDFLIPASEKERILGVKQSDQDTVDVNLFNKTSISTGSARAYNHTGTKGDSTKETLSFTTYTANFATSLKEADRTIWDEAEIFAKGLLSASIALHASIETALLAYLNTNKSQVVVSATPRSGAWDGSNYIFGVNQADKDYFVQKTRIFMGEQYYKDPMYDAILDPYLMSLYERLLSNGAGNANNTAALAQGLNAGMSVELTADSGYDGMGYIFPMGGIGIVPWIPKINRSNYGNEGAVSGLYTSIADPLGSGLTFAVHARQVAADNNSGSGETQDVNVHYEVSVDLAPIVAPMSASNAAPVFKFGLLS